MLARTEWSAFHKSVDLHRGACPPESGCPFGTHPCCKELSMLDLILLAIGLGFFALSVGYTIACDRLCGGCHDFRLLARRSRDRGADDLPRLRSAQARAALKGSTIMTVSGWIQILLFYAVAAPVGVPLGASMTHGSSG